MHFENNENQHEDFSKKRNYWQNEIIKAKKIKIIKKRNVSNNGDIFDIYLIFKENIEFEI